MHKELRSEYSKGSERRFHTGLFIGGGEGGMSQSNTAISRATPPPPPTKFLNLKPPRLYFTPILTKISANKDHVTLQFMIMLYLALHVILFENFGGIPGLLLLNEILAERVKVDCVNSMHTRYS